MPYNGSGSFSREGGSTAWVDDRNAGTKITADLHDTHDEDIAEGLTLAICKDGQSTCSARIPFAAGIGVSDGTVSAPGINFSSDTNTGIYRIGADNIGVSLGGAKVIDIGTTVTLHAKKGSAGTAPSWTSSDVVVVENTSGTNAVLQFFTSNAVTAGIAWSDPEQRTQAFINYTHGTNQMEIGCANATNSIEITTSKVAVLRASATALVVGPSGSTNPVLQVDTSTASVATGVKVAGAAEGSRVALAAISSGTNEGLDIDAKGSGTIRLGNTSTGNVTTPRALSVTNATASSSTTTGALTVAGGAGFAGSIFGASVVVGTGNAGFNVTSGSTDGWSIATGGSSNEAHASASGTASLWLRRRGSDGAVAMFYRDTANVGSVSVTGTNAAYNTTSDENLKMMFDEDDIDWGSRIDELWVGAYKSKADGADSKWRLGIRAQQAYGLVAQGVTRPKAEGEMYMVDYGLALAPLAMWGVKDLRSRVAKLELALGIIS